MRMNVDGALKGKQAAQNGISRHPTCLQSTPLYFRHKKKIGSPDLDPSHYHISMDQGRDTQTRLIVRPKPRD